MFWPSLAGHLYSKEDVQILKYILTFSIPPGVAVPLLTYDQYLQLISKADNELPSSLFRNMTLSTSFEATNLLYSLSVVCCRVNCRKTKVRSCTLPESKLLSALN